MFFRALARETECMNTHSTHSTHDARSAHDPFDGWVSLAEAARRLPSPRPGKRTHVSTIFRIARREGLEIRRLGKWRYVRWQDIVRLFVVDRRAPKAANPPLRRQSRVPAWVDESLRRHGLLKDEPQSVGAAEGQAEVPAVAPRAARSPAASEAAGSTGGTPRPRGA